MKKLITFCLSLISLSLISLSLAISMAYADQYGQYGGGVPSLKISLDKKIKRPDNDEWVDNLFASMYKFAPEQEMEFKLTITNTGNQDLENVKIKDTLPQYLNLSSGDLEITTSLKVGESKDFTVKAKVIKFEELPQNSGIYCVVNNVEAWADSQYDHDTAQICIEKKVLGFSTIPQAGPADNLALLLGSLVLGSTGFALLKKSH